MYEQARIDTDQLAEASASGLGLAKLRRDPREARYFLDMLRRQLPEFYDSDVLTSEGLRVYATLDLRIQRIAARVLSEELERLEKEVPGIRRRRETTPSGMPRRTPAANR